MSASIKLSAPEQRAFWKLPVVHESPGLLALDKPSHLLVLPEKQRAELPVLTKLLQKGVQDQVKWAQERKLEFIDLIYPLDFEASGTLLYATDKTIHETLRNAFGSRQIRFQFTTLVHGIPAADEFEVDLRLAPHPTKRWLVRVSRKKGKPCQTQCRVVERFRDFTLLSCETDSLRPHQIPVHLQQHGTPVVGDAIYQGDLLFLSQLKRKYRSKSRSPEKPLIDRSAVHLSGIRLSADDSKPAIEVSTPLAHDLEVALKFLRRFGS